MDMHYLGTGVRRVPMNQDEFDTKFNFIKESRARRLSVEDDGLTSGAKGSISQFLQLCGLCCHEDNIGLSSENVAEDYMQRHLTTTRYSSRLPIRMSSEITSFKRASLGGARHGVSTVTVPLCYELNYDGKRISQAIAIDDETLNNDGVLRSRLRFIRYFPFIDCLQRYSFRKDFIHDLRAGIILGFHSAVESLALAFLAGLPPIFGLYTTFCAAFIYMFFGVSPQTIMGSNMVVCYLIRNTIERIGVPYDEIYLSESKLEKGKIIESYNLLLQFTATLTFLVSFFHLMIYLFRIQFIFSYLSKHLLAGLSVGIITRIFLNQLQHILSVRGPLCHFTSETQESSSVNFLAQASFNKSSSSSCIYCMFWAIYHRIFGATPKATTNTTTLTISTLNLNGDKCLLTISDCLESLNMETLALSVFVIFFLIFKRQMLDPLVRLRLHYSIPFEFILILLFTSISHTMDNKLLIRSFEYVNEQFHFTYPRLALFEELVIDSLAIALLVFAMHASNIANIEYRSPPYWQQNNNKKNIHLGNRATNQNNNEGDNSKISQNNLYRNNCDRIRFLDERQELFAFAIIGAVSSFIGAYPASDTVERAHMANENGVKSLVVNISLVLTLLPMIVWLPAFIHALPVCVLSCIIIMNMGPLISGIGKINQLWNVSRIDLTIFLFTCLASIVLPNLSHAVFGGMIFTASTLIVRLQWPTYNLLVNVTGSGAYYAEKAFYGSELDELGVAVMRYEAPILFNNVKHFRTAVLRVAHNIKGQLLGIGIGTRAGSMKSMKSINASMLTGCSSTLANATSGNGGSGGQATIAAATCRDFFSTAQRSTLLISGDVVPNYDVLTSSTDQPQMLRVLILDFSSIATIDICGIDVLKTLYAELAHRRTRLLLASVNSMIRTRFKTAGGFDFIAKSMFFPTVHDAVLYAHQLGGVIAPSIHMSASLNGCQDLITLSATTSHLDISGRGNFSAQHIAALSGPTPNSGSMVDSNNMAMERSQSGGGSVTNFTIASGNSQSIIQQQHAPQASIDGTSIDALSTAASPTLSQHQQQLSHSQFKFTTKLTERHSNS